MIYFLLDGCASVVLYQWCRKGTDTEKHYNVEPQITVEAMEILQRAICK